MDWRYESWNSGEPYDWQGAGRGHTMWDAMDYHVDLGCGTVKKARIGIDRFPAPGVNIIMDLDGMWVFGEAPEPNRDASEVVDGSLRIYRGNEAFYNYRTPYDELLASSHGRLPFADSEIESIITHHCLEHIDEGFIALIDEVYRVLKPGGVFRAITPLFPSRAAVEDPDHKRYFMANEATCTWDAFCGHLGDENNPTGSWLDSFSVPYTRARFDMVHKDYTKALPPDQAWGPEDVRELRVALRAVK